MAKQNPSTLSARAGGVSNPKKEMLSSADQETNAMDIGHFESMDARMRIWSARNLYKDIHDRGEQICALALVLMQRLKPEEGGEASDYGTLKLAELLYDLVSEGEKEYQLKSCLQAMAAKDYGVQL